MLPLALVLIISACSATAAIITGTVTATCQAFSPTPVTNSVPFGQGVSCEDDPAAVYIFAFFDDFTGIYSWLADPHLPIGQGSVTTEFVGEVTARYVLTGGSGAAEIVTC